MTHHVKNALVFTAAVFGAMILARYIIAAADRLSGGAVGGTIAKADTAVMGAITGVKQGEPAAPVEGTITVITGANLNAPLPMSTM